MNITRRNTLRIFFSPVVNKIPSSVEMHLWIREQFKLDNEDVQSIEYDFIKKILYIKLSTAEICNRLLEEKNGEVPFIDTNNQLYKLTLELADPVYTSVKVHTVPSEMPNTDLAQELSKYGTIVSIREEQFNQTHFYTCRSGKKLVKIKLIKPIPSYITVKGHRLFVTYFQQPPHLLRVR